MNGRLAETRNGSGRRRHCLIYLFLTLLRAAELFAYRATTAPLDFEQNKNKIRTIKGQERKMLDLVQDVVSLVSMSAFLMMMAMWIGAM
jgi:hypothetical protein